MIIKKFISSKIGVKLILLVVLCFFLSTCVIMFGSWFVIFKYLFDGHINPKKINIINFTVFAASAFFFVLTFLFIVNKKIKYLKYISKTVNKIANGNLGDTLTIKGNDEIADICKNINYMSKELKEKFDNERNLENEKNELITGVSHDLRTPLTSILGYIDLIRLKQYKDENELNDYAEITYEKAKTLKKLIDELFEYTKLSNIDINLEYHDVDIVGLLQQMVGEYTPIFQKKDLKLNIIAPKKEIIMRLVPDKIARIFTNLLINALKYSDKNSVVYVEIKSKEEGVYISISNKTSSKISDNLDRLFDRFYKIDNSRSESEGTGLGLAISKRITELHKGKIWAEYKGENIIFNVYLPYIT